MGVKLGYTNAILKNANIYMNIGNANKQFEWNCKNPKTKIAAEEKNARGEKWQRRKMVEEKNGRGIFIDYQLNFQNQMSAK